MRIVRYYPRAAAGDGGMSGAVRHMAGSLGRAGVEVVLAYDDPGRAPPMAGVEWVRVPHLRAGTIRYPRAFEDALVGADLLVLHSAWTLHNVRAAAVARRSGVPYLLEPRGAYDPHIVRRRGPIRRAWWLALERRLVDQAWAVHVFFESERRHLETLGYPGPFVIAPNGITAPERTAWIGGGGYVLWLGRFDPEHKGLDLLLGALERLSPAERPTLRMHGPDWNGGKPRFVRMVRERDLGRWVKVGEPVTGDAKHRLLARSDGFVYPSRWEAFGNSTAEAVSIGVPTLVTPYPLGSHLAARGVAVLAPATADGLAEGLRTLRSTGAIEGAHRGPDVMREEFSWDAVTRSWLTQVTDLLSR